MSKCEKCKAREVKVEYSLEPMASLRNGYGLLHRCRECYIEDIEDFIKGCEVNLKEQKKLLMKENKMKKGVSGQSPTVHLHK